MSAPFDAEALLARIREADPELAAAMDKEEADPLGYPLPDALRARLDAWIFGQGFLFRGRRLDPQEILIVRVPE